MKKKIKNLRTKNINLKMFSDLKDNLSWYIPSLVLFDLLILCL